MNSNEIKKLGHAIVMKYEKSKGRAPEIHEKNGYDILSRSENKVRHIEVKSTAKSKFSWRYLTENEFKALVTDPSYYVYLVTNVGSRKSKVTELRRDELLKGYKRCEVLHIVTFPKELVSDEFDEIPLG
jgi:hypothetical protein